MQSVIREVKAIVTNHDKRCKNRVIGGTAISDLFARTASRMLLATPSAVSTGRSHSNLEVNVLNMPVDMQVGQTVVK